MRTKLRCKKQPHDNAVKDPAYEIMFHRDHPHSSNVL